MRLTVRGERMSANSWNSIKDSFLRRVRGTKAEAPAADLHTLSNGATLVNVPMPGNANVGVYLIVKAGSRDETPETAGLAHYLEHMFFKGSKNYPDTATIANTFADLGAVNNAYTDTEEVCYFAVGEAKDTAKLAGVLCDMLCHPLFDAEEMERERNVVRQELATRAANNMVWLGDNAGAAAFGGDQPMAWTAGGSDEVISKVTRDELIKYHASFYDPSKIALVICGGAGLSVDQAEKMLQDLPRSVAPKTRVPAVWGQGGDYVFKERKPLRGEQPQVTMQLMLPGLPAKDKDTKALQVMSTILGGGMWSRLFLTVRERNSLSYDIHTETESFEDAGVFSIVTLTRPEHAERAVSLAFNELRKLAETPVPEAELNRAKAALRGSVFRGLETARGRGGFSAQAWRAGKDIKAPQEICAEIDSVTTSDVQRMAQMLVARAADMRLGFVGPEDMGAKLLQAGRGALAPELGKNGPQSDRGLAA